MTETDRLEAVARSGDPGGKGAGRPAPFRLGRRPCIDGVRGVAALLVLGYHVVILSGRVDAPAFGFNGVFFVLSGFLITTMLLEEWSRSRAVRLRRFYLRRALRLLPTLFLVLAAAVALAGVAGLLGGEVARLNKWEPGNRWLGLGAGAAFIANWSLAFNLADPGPLRGTWSLAVEQQFYFLWPPILALLLRRQARLFRLAVILAVAAIGLAIYREAVWHAGASWQRIYFAGDTRADSILIGCVAGLLLADNRLPQSAGFRRALRLTSLGASLFIVTLVVLLFLPMTRGDRSVDAATVHLMAPIALATIVVILYLVLEPDGAGARLLGARWLGAVGRMSYGIYLWHTFYFWLCIKLFGYSDASALVMLGMTAVSAPLAYYTVELPMLRLKSRFEPAPPGAPAPLPAPPVSVPAASPSLSA